MRFIHFYLIVYFLLILGAGLALWQAGAFSHLSIASLGLAAVIAIGLGVLLALESTRPTRA
jgi:hypothetical protein